MTGKHLQRKLEGKVLGDKLLQGCEAVSAHLVLHRLDVLLHARLGDAVGKGLPIDEEERAQGVLALDLDALIPGLGVLALDLLACIDGWNPSVSCIFLQIAVNISST